MVCGLTFHCLSFLKDVNSCLFIQVNNAITHSLDPMEYCSALK